MLFFNANFICYYFYPTKKREEPLNLHVPMYIKPSIKNKKEPDKGSETYVVSFPLSGSVLPYDLFIFPISAKNY